ncbi:MAG TPA: hypothetical protein PKA81_12860, partial [Clostridia bacterium]|nr:hypothetical protein [Clostridia bacterium]
KSRHYLFDNVYFYFTGSRKAVLFLWSCKDSDGWQATSDTNQDIAGVYARMRGCAGGYYPPLQNPRVSAGEFVKERGFSQRLVEDRFMPPVGADNIRPRTPRPAVEKTHGYIVSSL